MLNRVSTFHLGGGGSGALPTPTPFTTHISSEDRTWGDKLRCTDRGVRNVCMGVLAGQADDVGRAALPYKSCR